MQVTPVPVLPVPSAVMPQETVAKTMPQIQAQAFAPIVQRAVDPPRKSDSGGKSRSNEDRSKGGGNGKSGRGDRINIRV